MADQSQFVLSNETEVCHLDCSAAFSGLTKKEKRYAHYLSQASWYGSLICLFQTSPEAPGIFLLLEKLFRSQTAAQLKAVAAEQQIKEEEFKAFLVYAAGFFSNMGNYKSFGDTKFVPNMPKVSLQKLVKCSEAYVTDPKGVQTLWDRVSDTMFSLHPKVQQLGLDDKGTTTYFSGNCDMKDAEIAGQFMTEKGLSAYNTRLFKTISGDETVYEICLASVETSDSLYNSRNPLMCREPSRDLGRLCRTDVGDGDMAILGTFPFTSKGASRKVTFKVTRGDYAPIMKLLVDNLQKAKAEAANDLEVAMLEQYIRSFTLGSIPAHKEGSRHWIKNKGPIVETYIGFIESYRDPFGTRGEFEGYKRVEPQN